MKYLTLIFLFSGCMPSHTDSLDTITEEVITKNRGVDIEITPEAKKQ